MGMCFRKIICYIRWIILIFDRCHHSLAVVTPVKYDDDIKQVIVFFDDTVKNWEHMGLAAPTLVVCGLGRSD